MMPFRFRPYPFYHCLPLPQEPSPFSAVHQRESFLKIVTGIVAYNPSPLPLGTLTFKAACLTDLCVESILNPESVPDLPRCCLPMRTLQCGSGLQPSELTVSEFPFVRSTEPRMNAGCDMLILIVLQRFNPSVVAVRNHAFRLPDRQKCRGRQQRVHFPHIIDGASCPLYRKDHPLSPIDTRMSFVRRTRPFPRPGDDFSFRISARLHRLGFPSPLPSAAPLLRINRPIEGIVLLRIRLYFLQILFHR